MKGHRAGEGAVITIHDVAKHAGVSSMTVSRVINKNVNVREHLRSKVLRSIEALNYTVNIAARSTRAGMGGARIGILYSNPSSAYLNEVMLGGLEQASKLGAQLILEKCTGLQSQKLAVKRLIDAGVDGVILPPPLCDSQPTVHMLTQQGIPVLALASATPLQEVSAVRIDDYQGALMMTRHLVKLGHKRIGFVMGDSQHTPAQLRYLGFRAAMDEAGLPVEDMLIAHGLFTYRSGLDAGRKLLEQAYRPTAIFASNDDMAAAVMAVAHGLKLSIPEELSICGFDDTPVASIIWPELTTIHQPIAEMGRVSVATIFEKIKDIRAGNPGLPMHHLMKFTLIERGSTAAAPTGGRAKSPAEKAPPKRKPAKAPK